MNSGNGFSKEVIRVIGVGGGGCNAVSRMLKLGIENVDFIAANTDRKSLESITVHHTIQLGIDTTRGRGAGTDPDKGRRAAEEARDEIYKALDGSEMVFVAAGMGGGTGTGGAPVVAEIARELGSLVVGAVTKPWQFEGERRSQVAQRGIEELRQHVDAILIIPNDNILGEAEGKMSFKEAFLKADEALHQGVRGITDVILRPGIISVDFADVRAIMKNAGNCMMGSGHARGENRATAAALQAIGNPMLEDISLDGATGILVNVTGGDDLRIEEFEEVTKTVTGKAATDCNIIAGIAHDTEMTDAISVTVIATGFDDPPNTTDHKNDIANLPKLYPKTTTPPLAPPKDHIEKHHPIIHGPPPSNISYPETRTRIDENIDWDKPAWKSNT